MPVTRTDGNAGELEFTLDASGDAPLYNPAFVIKNWSDRDVTLELDGGGIKRGKNFRYGFRRAVDGSDLIVWIKHSASNPTRIAIQ